MIGELALILLAALIVFAVVLNIRKRGFRSYVLGVLIGLDQLGNSLIGGAPDETISSRCGRGQSMWYWRLLGGILNAIQPGHIEIAMQSEKDGAHLPEVLR